MNEIKRYTSSGISWFNKTLWHRIYSQSNANEFSPYNTRFNSTISTQNKCNRTERIACSTLICTQWSSAHFSPVLLRSLFHRFFCLHHMTWSHLFIIQTLYTCIQYIASYSIWSMRKQTYFMRKSLYTNCKRVSQLDPKCLACYLQYPKDNLLIECRINIKIAYK